MCWVEREGDNVPTKCPICGTHYEVAEQYKSEECGGEGNCPAREAGDRPSAWHVLCACNRRWLGDSGELRDGHGFDDCIIP